LGLPAGVTCTYSLAAPGAPPNVLHVPIVAEAVTLVPFDCQ
jgi:hypothetical protein